MKRIAKRRCLKKKVVSTVAAAGAVVAIQIAPGCIIYAVMPPIDADVVDSGGHDRAQADAAVDHPIYYVMAQDAGPPQDAAQPHDAAQPSDAALPTDAGQPDVPIYYVMALDGGHDQDQPIYYIMPNFDAGAADHKLPDVDLPDEPIYYIMPWDY